MQKTAAHTGRRRCEPDRNEERHKQREKVGGRDGANERELRVHQPIAKLEAAAE